MMYFNETLDPAMMAKAASRVAIPGGRENQNGDVLAWLGAQGIEAPVFAGRCLHLASKR